MLKSVTTSLKTFPLLTVLGAGLVLSSGSGCRAQRHSPESPEMSSDNEESLVGKRSNYEDEGDGETLDEAYGPLPEIPAQHKVKKACKGQGKKRKCRASDKKPEVTAGHGVRNQMDGVRWGMDPEAVSKALQKRINVKYKDKMSKTNRPAEQDKIRDWRGEQLQALNSSRVEFETQNRHRWGVSLIQFEYQDDNGEEMIWVDENYNLKEYYFFYNSALWKIVYSYSEDSFPGKSYEQVLEEDFGAKFGPKYKKLKAEDPAGRAPAIDYAEWKAFDGESVRAFDMTAVNGAHMLSVVNGTDEENIGIRLPRAVAEGEKELDTEVDDVLGGSDVCYDEEGELVDDEARCKELGY